MRRVELEIGDEVARSLEAHASRQGLGLEVFLTGAIEQRAGVLHVGGREWMPRPQWEALVRGEDCPLCAALAAAEPADPWGHTVADLRMGRLRLAANQSVPGYSVFICNRHVVEPYHLGSGDMQLFFADLMRAAQALEDVFRPVKMNFELLGNAAPHLHCHIKPRYYGDPAPGMPIWPQATVLYLEPDEYQERVSCIREALA